MQLISTFFFFSIISLPWKKHFTEWQFEIIFQYRCRIIKSWSWSRGESTILYVVYTDINHLTFSFSHKPLLTKNETITYNTQLRIFEKYKLFEKRHLCVCKHKTQHLCILHMGKMDWRNVKSEHFRPFWHPNSNECRKSPNPMGIFDNKKTNWPPF